MRPCLVLFSCCLFTMCFYKVYSINCYVCSSTTSWADCNKKVHKQNCSHLLVDRNDVCIQQYEVKIDTNGTIIPNTELFKRECAKKNHCKIIEPFCSDYDMMCKASCCTKDYCNTARQSTASYYYHWMVCLLTILVICYR